MITSQLYKETHSEEDFKKKAQALERKNESLIEEREYLEN
jgi:hypothetical protein